MKGKISLPDLNDDISRDFLREDPAEKKRATSQTFEATGPTTLRLISQHQIQIDLPLPGPFHGYGQPLINLRTIHVSLLFAGTVGQTASARISGRNRIEM